MILQSIKLNNIRSYKNEEIQFPIGSVLLSGDIGSGKTTILLAIEFALFGIRKGELSGQALLRHGAKEGSVELKFSVSDGNFSGSDASVSKTSALGSYVSDASTVNIILKRNLKRTKDSVVQDAGFILINDKKVDCTPQELKAKVFDVLGYPKQFLTKSKDYLYRYTVYTPQEEMKAILFEEKDTRLEILRRIFGIHKYKVIRDNAEIYSKELNNLKRELSAGAAGIDDKKKQAEEKKAQLKDIEEKLLIANKNIEITRKRIEKKEFELRELDAKARLYRQLAKEKDVCEAKISEKQSRLKRLAPETASIERELKALSMQADSLRASLGLAAELADDEAAKDEELETELHEKESFLNKTEREKSIAALQFDNYTKTIKTLEEEILKKEEHSKKMSAKSAESKKILAELEPKQEIETAINAREEELAKINKHLQEFQIKKETSEQLITSIASIDKCPTCLQEVGPYHKKHIQSVESQNISKYKEKLDTAMKLFEAESKELAALRKKIDVVREKEKMLHALEAEIRLLALNIQDFDAKKRRLEEQHELQIGAEQKLAALRSINTEKTQQEILALRNDLKKIRELKNLQTMIRDKTQRRVLYLETRKETETEQEELLTKKQELLSELSLLSDAEKLCDDCIKELSALKSEEKEFEIKKAGIVSDIENTRNSSAMIEQEIRSKEASLEKLKDVSALQHWLDNKFVNITYAIEKIVMSRIHREFNELFHEWFSVLVEDELISARLDESFTPIIEQNGYETEVDNLSGGEKTGLALAYRLSLNRVINDFVGSIKTKGIIILDEPTDGFSTEQLDKLRDVLDQLGVKQCIIVSHETKIESMVEQIIRISKREHSSSVSYS